ISQEIERHPAPELREVTASAETIRRMITGKVLAVDQDRVQAVFLALCKMAKVDPDAPRWDEYDGEESETNWQYVQRLWDTALEEEGNAPSFPEDPWARDSGSGDE